MEATAEVAEQRCGFHEARRGQLPGLVGTCLCVRGPSPHPERAGTGFLGGESVPSPSVPPLFCTGSWAGGSVRGLHPLSQGQWSLADAMRAACAGGTGLRAWHGPRFILRLGPGRTSPLGPGAPEPSVRFHTARHGLSLPPSGRPLVNCSDQTLPTASWLWTHFPLIYLASE